MSETWNKVKSFFGRQKSDLSAVSSTVKVLKDVYNERSYQDTKWGGTPFDRQHSEAEWLTWINEYANGTGRAEGRAFRERMIKTAALAVAAVEALDSKPVV